MLNRDQFLNGIGQREFTVVKTTIGEVRVQALTESERVTQFDQWLRPKGEKKPPKQRTKDSRLKLVTLCVVDEQGQTYLNEDDIPKLREMLAKDVQVLADTAGRLCGFGDDEEQGLGESES